MDKELKYLSRGFAHDLDPDGPCVCAGPMGCHKENDRRRAAKEITWRWELGLMTTKELVYQLMEVVDP